jgi:monoamine oxidase
MSRSPYDKIHRRFGQTLPESEISARSGKLIDDLDQNISSAHIVFPTCEALKKTRVAIVGGGFAGMMAAWSLCQRANEIEVVVFEAGKDVGGRVRSNTEFTNGSVIEFGAELVGANHPTWLRLATDLGVALMTRTGEDHYALFGLEMKHRIDGKDIDPKIGKQLEEEMKKILVAIGKEANQIGDSAKPWLRADNRKLDDMSVLDKLTGHPPDVPNGLGLSKDKLVFKEIKLLLENNLVTPLAQINYLGLLCLVKAHRFGSDDQELMGFWEQTEAFRCSDGCQSLVRAMAARLADKKHYKFTLLSNTPVKEIVFDLTAPIKPRPAALKWERSAATSGVNSNFDYVILAVPPSVWDEIRITPQHPKDTIGSIQMGPAVKFFSNLDKRFWFDEKAAPSGISSDIGMIWEATDNQMLIGKQEAVLAVFAGGLAKTGRVLTEHDFKTGLKSLYRGYDRSSRGKRPKLQNWSEEKFILTGYSCPRPGHIFKAAAQLQGSFLNGRLFLAGEYTQTNFFGFMEGALRSGRRVADAVIAEVCPPTSTV